MRKGALSNRTSSSAGATTGQQQAIAAMIFSARNAVMRSRMSASPELARPSEQLPDFRDRAARQIEPEQDHRDQEPAAERFRRHPRAHRLADEHAGEGAAIATAPGNAVAAVSRPDAVRLKASATVATVKNTPSACTSSSFSMPIACMNGIDGITCTPVAAEITPVMTPTMPPTHFSFAARDVEAEFAQAR